MTVRHPEVDRYLLDLPAERRRALRALRETVHKIVPDAVETMDYRMPTFRVGEHFVCSLASQKAHMSLYTCGDTVLEPFRAELAGLDCGVGCVRFKTADELDGALAERIIQRACEVACGKT